MSDTFHLLDEPMLKFGSGQLAEDPRDGLALFGPAESPAAVGQYVVIGTQRGVNLWPNWVAALNGPAACEEVTRQRAWPPFPGFDVAFGVQWPSAIRTYAIDNDSLSSAARKSDRFERAFSVANMYLAPMEQLKKLDARPSLVICVVPDDVYENCRPQSSVKDKSDEPKSKLEKGFVQGARKDRESGQTRMFDDDPDLATLTQHLEQYGYSPDFRRQLKARMMPHELPIQIVRESTLDISDDVRAGRKGVNPLSDRLWNFGTALFYKCGWKPWTTPWAREGVCYIGLAYRRSEHKKGTACCAAQLFLSDGDGIVFVGEFGPWYSDVSKEFHLKADAAEKLLRGTIETYRSLDGRPLREIFLHSRSGINGDEYAGFLRACPDGAKVVGVRVRQDRFAPRLFRYDNHPNVSRRGMHPVLRGTFWRRSARHGLLFTSGFKPRIGTYDGWEVPVPLSISVQQGEADIMQVATDILGLTKLNYNACRLGEGQPITVKYSDRIGEVLLANPELPSTSWRHNFKYYV